MRGAQGASRRQEEAQAASPLNRAPCSPGARLGDCSIILSGIFLHIFPPLSSENQPDFCGRPWIPFLPCVCTAGSGAGGLFWGSPGCYGEGRKGFRLQLFGPVQPWAASPAWGCSLPASAPCVPSLVIAVSWGQEGWERGPGWLRRWAGAGEVAWSPWHLCGGSCEEVSGQHPLPSIAFPSSPCVKCKGK